MNLIKFFVTYHVAIIGVIIAAMIVDARTKTAKCVLKTVLLPIPNLCYGTQRKTKLHHGKWQNVTMTYIGLLATLATMIFRKVRIVWPKMGVHSVQDIGGVRMAHAFFVSNLARSVLNLVS